MGKILVSVLNLLAWFVYVLPMPLRRGMIDGISAFLRWLRFREKVIMQNLEFAYPGDSTQDEQTRARLFSAAYDHLAELTLEILLLFGPMKNWVKSRSELRGVENWRAAHASGRGVLFLSSHVGNWEIMAATGAQFSEMDLMLVTKHLKPEWFHEAIEQGRRHCGVRATYEPRTLKDVLRHLKAGGTVGFVQDQYAGPPIGVRVPFFGVPVGTISAVAVVAKRTGAPVLPVVNYRDPVHGRYVVEIQPPLAWRAHGDPDLEIAQNTAHYSEVLEGHIRQHPEQWLWTHRRFKGDLSPLREDEWSSGRSR